MKSKYKLTSNFKPQVAGWICASLLAALAIFPFAPVMAAPAPQQTDNDGLERIKIKNVDVVDRRPGVDWSSYSKVLIFPVTVAFSKSWRPQDYGTFGLSGAEITDMRSALASLTKEVFAKVLEEGGYSLVDAPGEGVLGVRPDIVDLYINAPDKMEAGRSRSYVTNAGEMRLALELTDTVTGTVLARARDRKRGMDTGQLQWANSVYNRSEAERALRGWALQLKSALDAAKSR